jgi:hypothetical protein
MPLERRLLPCCCATAIMPLLLLSDALEIVVLCIWYQKLCNLINIFKGMNKLFEED